MTAPPDDLRAAEAFAPSRTANDEGIVERWTPERADRGRLFLGDGGIVLERDLRIPLRDGSSLSACVYRPAAGGPFPTILEYLPYRKDDATSLRDRSLLAALALEGFACVRVDIRGTGDSDGVALDEYTEIEQEDGCEALAWIAEQEWSTGSVGMFGVSYGGFSAIQLAARRPPELKAIAAVYATDDRYTDDMHYFGGAVCALELGHYPLRMLAMNALPPEGPLDEAGREAWRERIEETPAWVLHWLSEQHDGPYWRNGSLRPDHSRIECPVLLVGGWRDPYRNTALRMAQHLRAPWELVMGPWPHVRPHIAAIPPRIDFAELLADWFRRALVDGDACASRRATVFVQEYDDPRSKPERLAGEWREFDRLPSEGAPVLHLYPDATGRLTSLAGESAQVELQQAPQVGVRAGNWCPPPPLDGVPLDQRPDEAFAATFDTPPLADEVVSFGFPRLRLRVEHPGPTAVVSVKLCDVGPDGSSQLVTRGVLNLAHRGGHVEPRPMRPDSPETVEIELQAVAWRFAPGHRIRLAIAPGDWPTVWPAPTTEALRLFLGDETSFELPLAAPSTSVDVPEGPERPAFGAVAEADESTWRIVHDAGSHTVAFESDGGVERFIPDLGVTISEHRSSRAVASEHDPLAASVEATVSFELRRPGEHVRTTSWGRYTCTRESFRAELELEVELNGEPFAHRAWDERIPRRLV